jgi:hypothetical protein
MSYFIPFVNSKNDWLLAQEFYSGAVVYRVTVRSNSIEDWAASAHSKLWVDTEVDALHNWPKSGSEEFTAYFGNFPDAPTIGSSTFWSKPDRAIVARFVNAILGDVLVRAPSVAWLSIPQLPHCDGGERNKINRALADATQEWKSKSGYKGTLVLPAIFTHQKQLNNKTERNVKVDLVAACCELSGADCLWVVDSSLHDQDGTGSFAKRFHGIIKLHEELNQKVSPFVTNLAGPYWALGLVLWARGLVEFTTLGVGRGYQYYIPGDPQLTSSKVRVALPPLRRQAIWSSGLKEWIEGTFEDIPKGDPAYSELSEVLSQFSLLKDKLRARRQVAKFYREWLGKFESIPAQGRMLALYQDFSSAYVLGKTLDDIPDSKVRSASKIAEQFMMTCL